MSTKQVFGPILDVVAGAAGHMLTSSRQRRTERLLARFSIHQLEDIGFERDWDGSVYRPTGQR